MKSTISLILLLFITIGYSEPEVIKRDNEPDFILTKDKKMDFAIFGTDKNEHPPLPSLSGLLFSLSRAM